MRKGLIKFLMLGTLAFLCSGSVKVEAAATTKIDGVTWVYTVENNKAVNVYASQGAPGNLVIPEKLNGYEVVSVGGGTDTTPVATNLTSVTFPDCLQKINSYAFYNTNLKDISLGVGNKIESVGNMAFKGSSLESVIIGENVKQIGEEAFSNCKINDLDLGTFTGKIGDSAFQENTDLEELYVGRVSDMGEYVFKGCTSLKNLEVDCDKLTTQFQDCCQLENIVIGENVKEIASSSFLVKNCGAAKAKIEPLNHDASVRINEYYLSDALVENKAFDTKLQAGGERNWYFKNPNCKIGKSKVSKNSTFYQSWKQSEADYGYVDKITYSSESIFFPYIMAETFLWDNYKYLETYLAYHITFNGITYSNKEACIGEYNNTPTGYAQNNVYVACGASGEDSPEHVQENIPGVYESYAMKAVKIINDVSEEDMPSYMPTPVITSIEVEYPEEVTEGVELSPSKLIIKAYYNNGTQEKVLFNSADMKVSGKEIVVGKNTFHLNLENGVGCDFEVVGVKKQIESIEAEYPEEVTAGEELSLSKLIIKAHYNNGTGENLPFDNAAMKLSGKEVVEGKNIFHLSLENGVGCDLLVTGVAKKVSNTINEQTTNTNPTETKTVSKNGKEAVDQVNKKIEKLSLNEVSKKKVRAITNKKNLKSNINKGIEGKISKPKKKTFLKNKSVHKTNNKKKALSTSGKDCVKQKVGAVPSKTVTVYTYPDGNEQKKVTSWTPVEVQNTEQNSAQDKTQVVLKKTEKQKTSVNTESVIDREQDSADSIETTFEGVEMDNKYSDVKLPKNDKSLEGKKSNKAALLITVAAVIVVTIGVIIFNRKKDSDMLDESEFVEEEE